MSFLNIQTALDSKLDTVPNVDLPIFWESVNFKVVNGQSFLRPTNLRAVSDQLTLTNDSQNNVGIYQVDVFVPVDGAGQGAMLDIIDKIFNHFKAELTLTSNGTEVFIRNISMLPLVKSEDVWWIGGVQINYASYF